MGAHIAGIGSHVLTIDGGRVLAGAVHTVLPDRIEFGTLACAAAATDGELILLNGRVDLLGAAAPLFDAAGVATARNADGGVIARRAAGGLRGIDVTTGPYPEFRDRSAGADHGVAGARCGASAVTETVFEQRFRHVDELRKMGADIAVRGRTALVRGVARLHGASVTCTDVRAAAALVIAGLGAAARRRLDGLDHLDRGYDRMAEKLAACRGGHRPFIATGSLLQWAVMVLPDREVSRLARNSGAGLETRAPGKRPAYSAATAIACLRPGMVKPSLSSLSIMSLPAFASVSTSGGRTGVQATSSP